jgi:hypothetical protein
VSAISLDAHECGLLQRDAEYWRSFRDVVRVVRIGAKLSGRKNTDCWNSVLTKLSCPFVDRSILLPFWPSTDFLSWPTATSLLNNLACDTNSNVGEDVSLKAHARKLHRVWRGGKNARRLSPFVLNHPLVRT